MSKLKLQFFGLRQNNCYCGSLKNCFIPQHFAYMMRIKEKYVVFRCGTLLACGSGIGTMRHIYGFYFKVIDMMCMVYTYSKIEDESVGIKFGILFCVKYICTYICTGGNVYFYVFVRFIDLGLVISWTYIN